MKKTSFVVVAALSLAAFGCKKKGADCGAAIHNSMELSKADMAKMPGMDDKTMQKMKDIGLQHCADDKWSEDAVKCMSEAKTEADAQGCYGKLSHEQQQKMNKAAMEMMKPPAPPAATGTDMGSAGAGSGATNTGSAGSAAPPK